MHREIFIIQEGLRGTGAATQARSLLRERRAEVPDAAACLALARKGQIGLVRRLYPLLHPSNPAKANSSRDPRAFPSVTPRTVIASALR